ncbi:MAG: Stk1 family PASTA domain-containing Ser/Thr kinase [Candidatus Merdivicinus sp.]|jgi:serine/threonine protein kinase/beta-lactam-binding protein with PASTA domain
MENYIGKRLTGRYELIKLIGSGGMANVFEAKDLLEQKIVAIKLLKEEYLTNEEFVRRFRNESKVIAVLDHPNVVKVYDVNFTGAEQYIVMEYIDGITMRQYINHQGKLRWKDAVHFTTQILKALEHAHENGVIHRDIKSQNIMLLRDGTIKVMDFGIARFAREDIRSMDDRAIGSVHYISPEQACGEESDEKSDIYSVGVLLYEMLTGRVPFDGETPEQVAMKHIHTRPVPVSKIAPDVPTGLCEITEKAMQKDKNMRYRSATEMIQAIERFKQNPNIVFEYKYMPEEPPANRYTRSVNAIQAEENTEGEEDVESEERVIVKRSPTILILTGIAAACVITALLVLMGFFYYGREEKVGEIAMPNLIGMDYDTVRKMEEYQDFHFVVVENDLSEYPKGQIYYQSIEPGIMVKTNRRIQVKVSAGIEVLEVPELTGLYVGEAEDKLADLGLEPIIRTQKDTTVEADRVIKTDPPAGQQVEQGTQVILYVSRAEISSVVKVPLLVGYDIETAKQKLEALDLKLQIEEVDSDEKPGTVIEQSLPQNEYAQSGSTIVLKVSNGSGYSKEAAITVAFPEGLPNQEYDLSVYVNGEEILREKINPGQNTTWVGKITGQGTMEAIVVINNQKYAAYEVNFEENIATLTDGYHLDVFQNTPEPSEPSEAESTDRPEEPAESSEESSSDTSDGEISGGDSPDNAPEENE